MNHGVLTAQVSYGGGCRDHEFALRTPEIVDRARRCFQRRLREARLPTGQTLDSFDVSVVPTLSKAHMMALCAGDRWLDEGSNQHSYRVLFARTTDLAQRLQAARRELGLEAESRCRTAR